MLRSDHRRMRDGNRVTYVLHGRLAAILPYQKLEEPGYRFHMRQASRGPNSVAINS